MDEAPQIPDVLHSAEREGPFTECTSCGGDLNSDDAEYHLQKSFRNGQVVFEMALCHRCAEDVSKDFSEESVARVRAWCLTHFRPSLDLGRCHFCSEERQEDPGYEMAAVCRGSHLLRPVAVMCSRCSERSQENLSEQTRRGFRDFLDRTLPGVPREMEPDMMPITF